MNQLVKYVDAYRFLNPYNREIVLESGNKHVPLCPGHSNTKDRDDKNGGIEVFCFFAILFSVSVHYPSYHVVYWRAKQKNSAILKLKKLFSSQKTSENQVCFNQRMYQSKLFSGTYINHSITRPFSLYYSPITRSSSLGSCNTLALPVKKDEWVRSCLVASARSIIRSNSAFHISACMYVHFKKSSHFNTRRTRKKESTFEVRLDLQNEASNL